MSSIRTFLVVILIASITIVISLSVMHGYRQGLRESQASFESRLEQQAHLINAIPIEGHDNGIHVADIRTAGVPNEYAFQLVDGEGRVRIRSENSPDKPVRALEAGFRMANFSGFRWGTYALFDPAAQRWVIVAERDDLRRQLAEDIILESILPVVALLPLMALLVWVTVSIAMRPIRALADQLHTRDAANLSPLSLQQVPAELQQLAASANGLLRRLQVSFDREKRFNSDVAHELRTPIAAMKIHMHNLLNESGTDRTSPTLERLHQGIERMQGLIEQMLVLNRLMPENAFAHFVEVDMLALVRRVIEDLINRLGQHHLQIEGEAFTLFGDEFALEMLVKNLLENAGKYTPPGGTILIRFITTPDSCQLQISDSGPGIPPSEYEQVFERYYRIDGDRQSGAGGSGLGLSIVRFAAGLHRADIKLDQSEFATGLAVTVSFPRRRME